MFTFDGPNKRIILQTGTVAFTAGELYSRWKDWAVLAGNAKYLKAITAIGNEVISSGNNTPAFFFLNNGWRIRPQEADHTLIVTGNLIVEGGTDDPFVQTTGDFNVQIQQNVSKAPIVVTSSGLATGDKADIAALVWSQLKSDNNTSGSFGSSLQLTEKLTKTLL
jgi:hypothetical protein